ncbi:MAG: type II secretion system protein [Spartobacteria bacterium]|nr:type II secretion system protein [Spartobacteria bacterium]
MNHAKQRHFRSKAIFGFTLLEMLAAVAIVSILAALSFPGYQIYLKKARQATCMGNMRSLHASFAAYIADNNHWPPAPQVDDALDARSEIYWLSIMEPYGATSKIWLCPGINAAGLKGPNGEVPKMHYIPSQFDAKPDSPSKWPKQPWLIEMANAHGDGALISFPDGSIKSMNQVLREIK